MEKYTLLFFSFLNKTFFQRFRSLTIYRFCRVKSHSFKKIMLLKYRFFLLSYGFYEPYIDLFGKYVYDYVERQDYIMDMFKEMEMEKIYLNI